MAAHLKIKEISLRAGLSITIPYQYIGGGARSPRTNPYNIPQHINGHGDLENVSRVLNPAFPGAQKRAELLRNPLHSQGSPNKGGRNQKCLPHPCLIGGPKEVLRHPLHSRGSPNKGGRNQNWLPQPLPSRGPKRGGSAMSPLHSRVSPNKGGQNQKWPPHPCLFGGPKEGGSAT